MQSKKHFTHTILTAKNSSFLPLVLHKKKINLDLIVRYVHFLLCKYLST